MSSYAQIVAETESFECGVACQFARISHNRGLKLYKDKYTCYKTYNMQELACEYGLAPKVFEKFEIPDAYYRYGYVTETVDDTVHSVQQQHSRLLFNFYPNYYSRPHVDYKFFIPEARIIKRKLQDIGLDGTDLHYQNLGILSDGRIVCIDFSEMEFLNDNEES